MLTAPEYKAPHQLTSEYNDALRDEKGATADIR
jgi:hypothetical protein